MNEYGQLARTYWRTALPSRCSTLTDAFFTDLGRQVAVAIADLAGELEAVAELSSSYLTRVGQLQAIAAQARELVLADLVYLPPEVSQDQDPVGPVEPSEAIIRPDGMPWDPEHPQWEAHRQLVDETLSQEQFDRMLRDWRATLEPTKRT